MVRENSPIDVAVCTILLDKSFRILGFNEAARKQLALSEAKIGSDLRQDRDLAVFLPDDGGKWNKTTQLFGRRFLCRLQASVMDGKDRLELSVLRADSVAPTAVAATETERPRGAGQTAGLFDPEFVAMLGHELRNPLAAIQSGLELWRVTGESAEKARWVRETIEQQARVLARIVSHFEDLASGAMTDVGGAAGLSSNSVDRVEEPRHTAREVSRRVLIIDDNRALAEGLGFLLSLAGHEVRVTFDGRSGLAAAPDFRPDFVLLDIGLPDVDGYEVAARLRALSADSPARIIAISGYSADRHRRNPERKIFDDYLVKPVSFGAVTSLLRQAEPEKEDVAADRADRSQAGENNRTAVARRVLVVEDNRAVADLTKELLEAHGYAADVAYSAEQAITKADELKPDVVLCDLHLNGRMSGWDVARAIRARMKPTPLLIAISAYSADVLKLAVKGSAFDAQMPKPLDVDLLETVLDDRSQTAR